MDAVPMNAVFEELARRPDIEVVDTRCRELLAAVRDTLVAELGLRPWEPSPNPVNASTGRGVHASVGGDGEIRRYSSGRSPGNLADADWPRATAMVADLAAQHGFTGPTVVVDRPGDHEVSFRDEYGGELLFGTAANTTLSLTTGCHLTREAFLRGPTDGERPAPTQAPPPEPPRPAEDHRRPPAPRNPEYRPAPTIPDGKEQPPERPRARPEAPCAGASAAPESSRAHSAEPPESLRGRRVAPRESSRGGPVVPRESFRGRPAERPEAPCAGASAAPESSRAHPAEPPEYLRGRRVASREPSRGRPVAPPEAPRALAAGAADSSMAAPKSSPPPRRRRPREEAVEEDFDTLEFVRKRKR